MAELNSVNLTGNLTKDVELRHTNGGTPVASLRVASSTRRKNGDQWEEKPNYFDVVVWGAQAENAAKHLAKGRRIGVSGRLEWREWKDANDNKRQSVEIVAEQLVFLGGKGDAATGGSTQAPATNAPADDDDIPF